MRNRQHLLTAAFLAMLAGFSSVAISGPPAPTAAGTSWTPADDWRDANELETFSSICEELPIPAFCDEADEFDSVVVDVETIGPTPALVPLGGGTMLKLSRIPGGKVSVDVFQQCPIELSCEPVASVDELSLDWESLARPCSNWNTDGVLVGDLDSVCPAMWLAKESVCAKTLPTCTEARFDLDLAGFQARYSQLMMEGQTAEARALAASFLGGEGNSSDELDIPTSSTRVLHEVSYNGKPARFRVLYPSQTNAVWDEVSQRTISFTFRGATIDQVAEFLRSATGLAVSADVPTDVAKTRRLYVACREQTVKAALEAVCRAGGFAFAVVDNRIVLSAE